jgi:co-chaperonin GroES (HSP10)
MILQGNRVIVQLDKETSLSSTSSGIEIPSSKFTQTDGGKLAVEPTPLTFLPKGTVIHVSNAAQEFLSPKLSPGDKVFVSTSAASPQYHFPLNRDVKPPFFDGVISVPANLIEAIIPNGTQQ